MGTHLNCLAKAVLTSTHNQCLEQKYEKKYQNFLSENFPFLMVKFSIYLNRCVFVMQDLSMVTSSQLTLTSFYLTVTISNLLLYGGRLE